MGVRDFTVSTNHPFNRYTSGQTVKGKVHFKTHSAIIIRGVYVRLRGLASVSWEERHTEEKDNKSVTTYTRYTGEHEYFDEKIYVTGAPDGDSVELPSGEHNYKFEYNLPVGLPTSFDGALGNISYTVTAVIDIPWRVDKTKEIMLHITSPIDLNTMPYLKNAAHISLSKFLCCFWCRSGPISVEINIPKTGYACGEGIPITADVENLSNTNITMVGCNVEQRISYHSEYPHHDIKSVDLSLCHNRLQGVPARSVRTYYEKLVIPQGADLNFSNCSLFDIEHKLKIKVYIDGCHLDLNCEMPIHIGSIPLKLNKPSAPSLSILAGLGSPYPYETEEAAGVTEASGSYLTSNQYGWMIGVRDNNSTPNK